MSLYQFEKGHAFLDKRGVPRLKNHVNNVVITRQDFTRQKARGEMEWRDDGVYLKVDGAFRRGYLYNRDYDVAKHRKMPSFHIAKCSTLMWYEDRNLLSRFYFFANAETVLVTQRRGREKYHDQSLEVCSFCLEELQNKEISNHATTQSEFAKKEEEIVLASTTDMFGRPMNWPVISKRYREKKNYTCEKCGTGGDDIKTGRDRMYFDADHIEAHELTNTADSNLQCLCVLCHYFKDELHEAKLAKPYIRFRLTNFVNSYKDILKLKNPVLLNRFRVNYRD